MSLEESISVSLESGIKSPDIEPLLFQLDNTPWLVELDSSSGTLDGLTKLEFSIGLTTGWLICVLYKFELEIHLFLRPL